MFELGPAAEEMSRLVSGVRDDQLDRPTPCPDWTVAGLLAHVHQFAAVFTHNALKEETRPPDDLVDEWRVAIPDQLDQLARAWRRTSAWQGRVSAGGVEMDAPDNAVVGIEELAVHGWDLARATSQDLRVDDADLDQVDRFFELFSEQIASGSGPFGPEAEAPPGATRLDRTIARTGRNPSWEATTTPSPRPTVGMYAFRSPDPRRLARFWADLMELPISEHSTDELVMLDLDHEVAPVTWVFERDPAVGAPTARLGLDLAGVADDGWREIADRAERSGAVRKAERTQGRVRWIEMDDPDGNPFRVFAPRPR